MTHADFLATLGGGTKIAQWLSEETGKSVDREAVYKWATNGIPLKWRFPLAKMARRKRAPMPRDFIPGVAA